MNNTSLNNKVSLFFEWQGATLTKNQLCRARSIEIFFNGTLQITLSIPENTELNSHYPLKQGFYKNGTVYDQEFLGLSCEQIRELSVEVICVQRNLLQTPKQKKNTRSSFYSSFTNYRSLLDLEMPETFKLNQQYRVVITSISNSEEHFTFATRIETEGKGILGQEGDCGIEREEIANLLIFFLYAQIKIQVAEFILSILKYQLNARLRHELKVVMDDNCKIVCKLYSDAIKAEIEKVPFARVKYHYEQIIQLIRSRKLDPDFIKIDKEKAIFAHCLETVKPKGLEDVLRNCFQGLLFQRMGPEVRKLMHDMATKFNARYLGENEVETQQGLAWLMVGTQPQQISPYFVNGQHNPAQYGGFLV